jgi:hypothetical protein
MKDYLILCFLIPLLLYFPIQFTVNQINHNRMSTVQNIVHNAAKRASLDGYFTNTNINKMKAELVAAFPSINPAEMVIVVTQTPKYNQNAFDQREMISYDVEIPIDQILAMPGYFGVSSADNKFMYPVKSEIPSEVSMP